MPADYMSSILSQIATNVTGYGADFTINPTLLGNGTYVAVVHVTPELARYWLGNMIKGQRSLRGAKRDQYGRDVMSGDWGFTGDTIKITPAGVLLDGQHRLQAVISTGIAIDVLVVFGVEEVVMPVIDTGLARSFADVLRIEGVSHRFTLAAVIRRVYEWERGNPMNTGGATTLVRATNTELRERFDKDPDGFMEAAVRGDELHHAGLGANSATGAAFFRLAGINHKMAVDFFDLYLTGANLPLGNPVLALRNRMSAEVGRRKDQRLNASEQLALIVRAWNAYRRGTDLHRIQISRGDLTNKSFPRLI